MANIQKILIINNTPKYGIETVKLEMENGTILNNVKVRMSCGSVYLLKDFSEKYNKNIEYISSVDVKKIICEDGSVFTKLHKYNEKLQKDIYYFDLKYRYVLYYANQEFYKNSIIEITYRHWMSKEIKKETGRLNDINYNFKEIELDVSEKGIGGTIIIKVDQLID